MKKRTNKKLSDLLLNKVKELTTGVTSEEVTPIYFDLGVLKRQPEILYRLDNQGYRYYYKLKDGEPIFYTSVTTMIKNTLPTPKALIEWQRTHDDEEMMERADYGTLLHECFAGLLINHTFDLDSMPKIIEQYTAKNKIGDKKEWETPLKKDILALAQFIIDYNVIPIAVELILYHPDDGYAGALDAVIQLDWEFTGDFGEKYLSGANKGQPKLSKQKSRINAIVDLKSGKKGFYESAEIQLKSYEKMFNIHFPDIKIDKLLNVSPKEWRTTPSYNLKDQTDAKSMAKLEHIVALGKIEEGRKEKSVVILSGLIEPAKGLTKNVRETSLTELIKEKL
jgi:hypothetical protein